MSDSKISGLSAASLPLSGSELVPIVQSGETKKVSVDNLSAGKTLYAATLKVQNDGSALAWVEGGSGTNEGSAFYSKSGSTIVTAYGDASSIFGGTPAQAAALYTGTGIPLNIAVNGSNRWQFKTDGNLAVSVAGKGLDFSVNTPSAGMTSQLLGYYEEGTWTPTQGIGLTVVGDFSSEGTYTRTGNQVVLRGKVAATTSVAISANSVLCGGFPYAAAVGLYTVGNCVNSNMSETGVVLLAGSSMYSSAIAATDTIYFSITYQV